MEVSHQGFRENLIEPTGRIGRDKHTPAVFFFSGITVALGLMFIQSQR